jgi:hypothetical protein
MSTPRALPTRKPVGIDPSKYASTTVTMYPEIGTR